MLLCASDVQFDKDENITPLESALMILIEMVDNNELPEDACTDLKQLLQVQVSFSPKITIIK